eukprot:5438626-Heterocapsa_arctica.AAC.1
MRNGDWHDDEMEEKHCGRRYAHACSPVFECKKPGDRQSVARRIRSEVHQDDFHVIANNEEIVRRKKVMPLVSFFSLTISLLFSSTTFFRLTIS